MSNIHDKHQEGQETQGEQTPPLNGHRTLFLTPADESDIDDDATETFLPAIKVPRLSMPRLSMPAELRSTAISLPQSSLLVADNAWMVDEETWMLPAIPRQTKAGEQPASSITQEKPRQKEQAGAQSYLSLALEMIKSSGIYAVGALASPLVSLVLTPFLAHNLSNTNYGVLAVLYTVVDLVTVLTQLGLAGAFFRAYNSDYDSARDRLSVLSATIILLSLASIPATILIVITAPWLSELLFNSPAFGTSVALTAVVILLENLTLPGISWFRAEKRPIPYTVLSIVNLLVVLGTNIGLVGVLHIGLNGALIAKGAGFAAMIVFTMPIMLTRIIRKHSFKLRFDIVRSMLAFGVPTIFSDMAAWVLQLSDRYLLSHFGSLAQTASYSVAYVLGGVLSPVVLAPWGLAWIPIMYAVAKRKDAAHIFMLVFRWWSSVLLFAAFALSLLSTLVLETLFPPSYQAAAPVIPAITLSTLLNGVWFIFMIGVNIRRKTILEFVYVLIAAVTNLVLNLFLIPSFGAIGAAVSTVIAYALLVIVSYIVNQRIYPIGFEIGSFVLRLAIGIALYVGSSILTHTQKPLISWSLSFFTLLVYGVILLALSGLTPQKIRTTFGYVQTALKKKT